MILISVDFNACCYAKVMDVKLDENMTWCNPDAIKNDDTIFLFQWKYIYGRGRVFHFFN